MSSTNINHVIVHELLKESNEDFDHSNPYNLRESELDKTNSIVERLVQGIIDLYGSKGNSAHYGTFIPDLTTQGPVPGLFSTYQSANKNSPEDFIKLTHQIMKQMYKAAKSQTWASGGYVVFSDYISQGLRFLLVTMIKKKDGVTISSSLEPQEMIHLELNNINQAAKINFDLYKQYIKSDNLKKQELSYLSFISKVSGQSAAAYFISALGCDKGIASAGATKKLPNLIRAFFKKEKELLPYADSFRNVVIKYLENQFNAKVSAKLSDVEGMAISHLSVLTEEVRDELVGKIMKHLNSEDIRIPSDFVVNKGALDKLRKVSFKTPLYSFNFDKELLGENSDAKIHYDNESGNLIFHNLPEEAKTKIRQALKEKDKTQEIEGPDGE